jgi:isoleucyl-tRNA synthetase
MILAPFVPFMAEELYQKLTEGESVHLLDWPPAGAVDERLVEDMALVRELITEGLGKRAEAKIKVRQPLRSATIRNKNASRLKRFEEIFLEELNVKSVLLDDAAKQDDEAKFAIELDTDIDQELKREGIMRELVRQVQAARKSAGLNVDDRIHLQLDTEDSEVEQAIKEHAETIKAETLAGSLNEGTVSGYTTDAKVDEFKVAIALVKA